MSGQGYYVEQAPVQPFMPAAQFGGQQPPVQQQMQMQYPPVNNTPYNVSMVNAPTAFQFRTHKVAGPDGRKMRQFESEMPFALAPMISADEFASRFAEINGLYAPEANRISRLNRNAQIGAILLTAVLVSFLAVAQLGLIELGWDTELVVIYVCLALIICGEVGWMAWLKKQWRLLHAQVAALLQKFAAMDQVRRLRWSLLTDTVETGNIFYQRPQEEPVIKLEIII